MAHAQVLHPWRQPLQALFHHDSAASRRAFAKSSWGARCRDRIADYEVRHSLQSCMDMQELSLTLHCCTEAKQSGWHCRRYGMLNSSSDL